MPGAHACKMDLPADCVNLEMSARECRVTQDSPELIAAQDKFSLRLQDANAGDPIRLAEAIRRYSRNDSDGKPLGPKILFQSDKINRPVPFVPWGPDIEGTSHPVKIGKVRSPNLPDIFRWACSSG